MSNPAHDLADMFIDHWHDGGLSVGDDVSAYRGWGPRTTLEAIELVLLLRERMEDLRREGVPLQEFPNAIVRWVSWILVMFVEDQSRNPNQIGDDLLSPGPYPPFRECEEELRKLGSLLDQSRNRRSLTRLPSLREQLDEIVQMLVRDESLDDELRAYLVDLVNEVRRALDE